MQPKPLKTRLTPPKKPFKPSNVSTFRDKMNKIGPVHNGADFFMLSGKTILLVISGGIAAYKALELIRLLRRAGANVQCILTRGGAEFITPLSVASLSENPVYTDLFSLKDETEMGHIRLSRETDLIVIAPASANLIAKLAQGIADDLASTTLLAANKPILFAPAMNQEMWADQATQDNLKALRARGLEQIGPASGEMACGETGLGRMAEPADIVHGIEQHFAFANALTGKRAIVTAGPTYEPIDPVRFIGNRSSGKQGFAIAKALARAGADVTLVTGPSALDNPARINTIRVETAQEMFAAVQSALPADIAVFTAAVSDWSPVDVANSKIKKNGAPPTLALKENPDILATISKGPNRPALVIGFAAETNDVLANARAKRLKKGCDWIVANDVSNGTIGFSGDNNQVTIVTANGEEAWTMQSKNDIAARLVQKIIHEIQNPKSFQEAASS